ncbi:MAG: hypothetical protein M1825_005227 [Sarcosagium campestre]|nr:MAG: hypothetical protein M1825_005227 [Sarcosagium campestre]
MLIPADSKEDLERPSTPTDSVFTPPDSQLGSPTPSVTVAGSAIDELDLRASQQHVQVSNEKFRIKGKEKVIASVESKTTYSEVPSLTPESKTNVKLSTRKDAASFRSMYNASPSPDPEPAPVPRITPSPSSQSPRGAAARPSRGRRTSTWYSAKDETPPVDEPFFDARFQAKFKRGLGLAKTVAETINSCDLVKDEGSELHRLWKTAVDLQNFQTPTSCRIGVVGDSGVGKSSLVNSLLDVGQIADTGDVGAACTSLVTEYRPRTQAQKENFTIEVDFMTQAEIDEQLEDLLSSHRYPYFCEHDRNSAEQKAKIEEKSKLAWSSLDAAFGDRADLTESFLQDDADGAFDRILERLKDWSDDIEWPGQGEEGSSEGTWLSTANTAEECQQKTSAFMKDRLWPFTKVVRVFLSAQILKSGVILADLPGFHDANLARAKAAQQYLHTCDQIFVVAGIARVITNKNVDEIMQDQLGHGMQNAARARGVALVCTKSDDIDQEAQIKFFKKTINLEEINDLRETIEDAEDSNDHEGVLQAQAELRNLFMETRNAHVRKQLLAMFTKIFSTDKEVHIFCVSNKLYKDNLRAGGKAGAPGNRARESITKSGIPALRRFCHTIPAQAQYRSANHFLQSKLPGYLRSLENWLAGNSQVQQNLQGAQAIIDRISRELEEVLHHSIDSIKEDLTCIDSFRVLGGDSGRSLSIRAGNVLKVELGV